MKVKTISIIIDIIFTWGFGYFVSIVGLKFFNASGSEGFILFWIGCIYYMTAIKVNK